MPTLHIVEGPMEGQLYKLTGDTIFVGRSQKNDIQIRDKTISRKQIKLFKIGNKFFVEDLKSTNGTLLNGNPITPGEGFEIGDGDLITIGDTVLRFSEKSSKPSGLLEKSRPKIAQERRSFTRNLQLPVSISEILKTPLPIKKLCEKVLESLLESLPRIDRATIVLMDPGNQSIKATVTKTRDDSLQVRGNYSRKIVEKTLLEGKSVRMSNTAFEAPEEFSETSDTMQIRSLLCVPLISNGKTRGALYVDSLRKPYGFRKEDLLLLNSLATPLAIALENHWLHRELS